VLPTGTKDPHLSRLPDLGQKRYPFVPPWRFRLETETEGLSQSGQKNCSVVVVGGPRAGAIWPRSTPLSDSPSATPALSSGARPADPVTLYYTPPARLRQCMLADPSPCLASRILSSISLHQLTIICLLLHVHTFFFCGYCMFILHD